MRGVSPAKSLFGRICRQYFRKSKSIRANGESNIIDGAAFSTRSSGRGRANVQPHVEQYYTSIVGHIMLAACSSGEIFRPGFRPIYGGLKGEEGRDMEYDVAEKASKRAFRCSPVKALRTIAAQHATGHRAENGVFENATMHSGANRNRNRNRAGRCGV
jgi:hypothetical protein